MTARAIESRAVITTGNSTMGTPRLAELGWLEFTIDFLRQSLKAAEDTAADLQKLKTCDSAGCGRMFDGSDPRSKSVRHEGTEYNFCAACEMESRAHIKTQD